MSDRERDGWFERVDLVLRRCGDALNSLPDNALGFADSGGAEWPIRDELVFAIAMVLAERDMIDRATGSGADGVEPSEWRAIDSAPRDGTILLGDAETGEVWCSTHFGQLERTHDISAGEHYRYATHWRPLPPPPSPETDHE